MLLISLDYIGEGLRAAIVAIAKCIGKRPFVAELDGSLFRRATMPYESQLDLFYDGLPRTFWLEGISAQTAFIQICAIMGLNPRFDCPIVQRIRRKIWEVYSMS
jgi:hypothetical protein